MALPTTREDLIDWCLRELGKPVIQVNLAEEQCDDAVDDALQFFREYHEDGAERTWYKHQITSQDLTNGYITLPENIQSVIGVLRPNALGNVSASTADNFFSFEYQFMAASVWDLMQFGNASGYFIANQYLAEMNMLFSQKTMSRFRHSMRRLYLDMNINAGYQVGTWLVADVSAYIDPDAYAGVWSNRWLRKLSVAYMKKRWGNNLKKFQNIQLPSGMVLNGQALFDEAMAEIEDIEAQIMRHQPPVGVIVG